MEEGPVWGAHSWGDISPLSMRTVSVHPAQGSSSVSCTAALGAPRAHPQMHHLSLSAQRGLTSEEVGHGTETGEAGSGASFSPSEPQNCGRGYWPALGTPGTQVTQTCATTGASSMLRGGPRTPPRARATSLHLVGPSLAKPKVGSSKSFALDLTPRSLQALPPEGAAGSHCWAGSG